MIGYISPARFSRVLNVPISLSQTELRRNKSIQITQVPVYAGQKLSLRSLNLHLTKIFNPADEVVLINSSMGLCSVGVYFGSMLTSPLAYAKLLGSGCSCSNPHIRSVFCTPGIYTVVISNNSSSNDLSACVTGSFKLYL